MSEIVFGQQDTVDIKRIKDNAPIKAGLGQIDSECDEESFEEIGDPGMDVFKRRTPRLVTTGSDWFGNDSADQIAEQRNSILNLMYPNRNGVTSAMSNNPSVNSSQTQSQAYINGLSALSSLVTG
jgi:hypothetical protein